MHEALVAEGKAKKTFGEVIGIVRTLFVHLQEFVERIMIELRFFEVGMEDGDGKIVDVDYDVELGVVLVVDSESGM
ncbi:MAG: hypothetical protein DRH04_05690 [Deltaproteobacteria bacterium]|nr:MAG: hypothetical protein DRH04_05690 [Deltaproteobacteria bacterium]